MTDPQASPFKGDIVPQALASDAEIRFRCYKGISCFNACCKRADITLTPYDIIRLKQRFGVTSGEFLKHNTVPYEMDADRLPGVKMRTDDDGACLLMAEEGCLAYEDRPTSCRYYPLGHLAMRHKDSAQDQAQYVVIAEDHCNGHEEDRRIGIKDYLVEQEATLYREMNREWLQLLLKKKSAGPTVGRPSEESLQLYFMSCFDVDRFRRFVLSDGFRRTYELDDGTYETLGADDLALMKFGFRFLRQVLFGEKTITERQGAWERRVHQRQEVWKARRQAEMARRRHAEDGKYKDSV